MMKHTLEITGMSCNNCVKHVTHALEAVEGVRAVSVSLNSGLAEVEANETLDINVLKQAVKETGYSVK